MNYKVVALDLDGTLLGPDGKVSERNRRAVKRAGAAGARVLLATGRPPYRTRHIYEELGLTGPTVTYDGALTVDFASGALLASHPVPPELVREIVAAGLDWGAEGYFLEMAEGFIAGSDSFVTRERSRRLDLEPLAIGPAAEFLHLPVCKVLFHAPRAAARALAARATDEHGKQLCFYHFDMDPGWVEVIAGGVSKATGVAELCRGWGLGLQDVVAFGDDVNDRELLQEAGLGVVMGNGKAELVAGARRVAPSHAEDGVAAVLEELF